VTREVLDCYGLGRMTRLNIASGPRSGDQFDGRQAAIILVLMMASQIINHFDRAVVAVASADIMRDLGLTLEQYGLLHSAFYSVFAVSGLLVGIFLAPRVRARVLVTILVALWTLAQLPALILPSFATLLVSRMILGAAESPSSAAAMAVTHEWYPAERRNVPSSLIYIGSLFGAIAAPPVLITIVEASGWQGGFLACAILSGILFAALLLLGRDPPRVESLEPATIVEPTLDARPKGWFHWADRRIIMITVVAFLSYWVLSFSFTWLFPMLHMGWGYGQREAGWMVSATYFLGTVPLLGLSTLSQKMLTRGHSFRMAVVIPTSACLVITAIFLGITAALPAGEVRLLCLILAFALLPTALIAIPIMVSKVASEAERSRMLMIVFAIESSAGMVAPYVTGLLIERNGAFGYNLALLSCSGAALLGGLLVLTLFRERQAGDASARGV